MRLLPNRIIIPGPPGTGKTHTLMNYLDKELKKTPADKIVYLAFSKAAAKEAAKRANNDEVTIKTMHAYGREKLDIDTNTQLLKGQKWSAFKNYCTVAADLSFETIKMPSGMYQYVNTHMNIIDYARNSKISLGEAAHTLDINHLVDINVTDLINKELIEYKKKTGMVEYFDMIHKFVEEDKCPPLHSVFLDEAQDLNPAQWDMFFYMERNSQRSYIAGDDDQAIYGFQGAEPKIFIDLKGTYDAQVKSVRVPRAVHKVAESILSNMGKRLPKKWEPRDEEGAVYWDRTIYDINYDKGTWMLLARTNDLLDPIKRHLENLNLRFEAKSSDLLPPDLVVAYQTWQRLHQGAYVGKEEVEDLWQYLRVGDGHIKRGFASKDKLKDITQVNIEDLRNEYGFQATGSWETMHIADTTKSYIKNLLESGDDLMSKARIKVSTIHGVKGEEAENVVLFTDMPYPAYKSATEINPDPEHRVFYVGVTRTKKTLFITSQDNEHQYRIGGQII